MFIRASSWVYVFDCNLEFSSIFRIAFEPSHSSWYRDSVTVWPLPENSGRMISLQRQSPSEDRSTSRVLWHHRLLPCFTGFSRVAGDRSGSQGAGIPKSWGTRVSEGSVVASRSGRVAPARDVALVQRSLAQAFL